MRSLPSCSKLTPAEYAYILSTFPLLDRDQPPLPGDHRVRPTNKGIDRRRQSFITRDLALLTYFDYLADRLDVKPDTARVSRICPDGVPEPPTDIVAFFAEAGVDISGARPTGPSQRPARSATSASEFALPASWVPSPTFPQSTAAAPPSSSVPPRPEGSPPTRASSLPRCPSASSATRPSATPSGSVRCRYGRIFLNRPDLE